MIYIPHEVWANVQLHFLPFDLHFFLWERHNVVLRDPFLRVISVHLRRATNRSGVSNHHLHSTLPVAFPLTPLYGL